jgi:hypothetical protein
LESAWPVHGSVLVQNEVLYCSAGRSSNLDGGITLYGLDPQTGRVLHHSVAVEEPATADIPRPEGLIISERGAGDYKTELAPDRSDGFEMKSVLSEILVGDKDSVYLRTMEYDTDLQLRTWENSKPHLFSTSGLLDSYPAHRTHWFYGTGKLGKMSKSYCWMAADFITPIGRIMVFDDESVWGVRRKKGGNPYLYRQDITTFVNPDGSVQIRDTTKSKTRDPLKRGGAKHYSKTIEIPFHAESILKAGELFWVGGYHEERVKGLDHQPEPTGYVAAISEDKGVVTKIELPALPVFDGLAAAGGGLYISLKNSALIAIK